MIFAVCIRAVTRALGELIDDSILGSSGGCFPIVTNDGFVLAFIARWNKVVFTYL